MVQKGLVDLICFNVQSYTKWALCICNEKQSMCLRIRPIKAENSACLDQCGGLKWSSTMEINKDMTCHGWAEVLLPQRCCSVAGPQVTGSSVNDDEKTFTLTKKDTITIYAHIQTDQCQPFVKMSTHSFRPYITFIHEALSLKTTLVTVMHSFMNSTFERK